MKIRLSKSLKNNEIASSYATERDELSRHWLCHYYARLFQGANEGSIWPDFRLYQHHSPWHAHLPCRRNQIEKRDC